MLIKTRTLKGYKLLTLDEEIGRVKEFYFDDLNWKIRYLLADTGKWLPGRKVLISPESLIDVRNNTRDIAVKLTKKQIEESPSLDTDKPVSRQFEEAFYEHYSWPIYWEEPYLAESQPYMLSNGIDFDLKATNEGTKPLDAHLRSTHNMSGYAVRAKDGEIGRVDDFIIDDLEWAVRYLIVDLHDQKKSEKVLISPKWIDSISWDESQVFVNLLIEDVKSSPKYIDDDTMTRDYENGLHRHYNRSGYWED
jgi:hypothetical protein